MGTKVCRCCGVEKDLETEFYTHKAMSDGYLNKCKECVKNRVKKHRAENDSVREYDRKRYYSDPKRKEYSKRQTKEWYTANKERARELTVQWISRNPEKRKAHIMVGNAIRNGKLTKGSCEVCGSSKVEAHHDDYSKPLSVRWLCRTHHAEGHRKYKVVM